MVHASKDLKTLTDGSLGSKEDLKGRAAVSQADDVTVYSEAFKAKRLWNEKHDEIDELKKIFYEFLQKWIEDKSNEKSPNEPIVYTRLQGEREFVLLKDRRALVKKPTSTFPEMS